MGMIDGVTTNPSLISKENKDFNSLIQEICGIIQGLPISLEVISLKSEEMIKEARTISKSSPQPKHSWLPRLAQPILVPLSEG
jgi:transaldolase